MNCDNHYSISELGRIVEYVRVNKLRAVAERIARKEMGLPVSSLNMNPAFQDFDDSRDHIFECKKCRENYLWYLAREAWADLDSTLLKVNSPEVVGKEMAQEYRQRLILHGMARLDEQCLGVFKNGK